MTEQRSDAGNGDELDVDTDADELGEDVDPDTEEGLALSEGRLGGDIPGETMPSADDAADERADEQSRESFPASDPPASWAGESTPPPPR